MGLGAFKNAWQWQTKDFGHTQADKYSVLVLDNRGMGDSDKPLARYSTSEMARDLLEVIDHVGWTGERELHLIGISMGGMIAQELALLAPTRLASLLLLSTAARLINTVGYFENLLNRAQLFIPKPLDTLIANAKRNQFSDAWAAAPDETEAKVTRFPTNGDRYAAFEVQKRRSGKFPRGGFICQAVAAGWHYKSAEQLREMADRVGRRRIVVVHGTADRMITYPHGRTLVEELNMGGDEGEEVRFVEFTGTGHVVHVERRADVDKLIEEMVERAATLS